MDLFTLATFKTEKLMEEESTSLQMDHTMKECSGTIKPISMEATIQKISFTKENSRTIYSMEKACNRAKITFSLEPSIKERSIMVP